MKVSVCLASYNGEAFLARQLASILADLGPDDEVILSDDGSRDRTIEIAHSFADPRMKICHFTKNLRHVGNFERALSMATGDVIFLSDQDDIWVPGKRDLVLAEFARSPDVVMVVHALKLIDGEGRELSSRSDVWPVSAAGEQSKPRYLVRQIVKNQVTGCATTISRRLLNLLMPFPAAVYAHDHWMAVAAPFVGTTIFLDVPLVEYRQHDANVTPKNGLSPADRLKVRLKLIALVAIAAARAVHHRPVRND